MAMTYNAQNAPFGAVSVYRVSSALYGVAQDALAWQARRTALAELQRLTPNQLEDIGLSLADVNRSGSGFFARSIERIKDAVERIRAARELSLLSPRLLDDIGMNEADVDRIRREASIF
ncbi:MAG: DUF1127 domain-containing protein [Pseudomonadota bacterium]